MLLKPRWILGGALAAVIVGAGIPLGWHYHAVADQQYAARSALRDVHAVQQYAFGRTYTGAAEGFQCTIVAGARPSDAYAKVSGTFTLTYNRANPPGAILWYFVIGKPGPSWPRVILNSEGENDGPWPAVRVGPNRYYYWVIHWNGLPVELTPHEWRTGLTSATVKLHLANGQDVVIPLKPS
ncbi:hypothetical protein [Sulfobacillus harzensis]|uniref:Uncharacterized protein n=1 Tax=Sulfobacillus harzensis TaxID=2729629 RepID=A0A7Y0Q5Z5_9FIRM|nr:hypothetical protein [Sulfobacillus harzensis]NMP24829.1 hypothetical protein [Sulfobacillus harzensis]